MDERKNLSSHPLAQALGVGASVVTVVGFVAGAVVLIWGATNDKLALALGFALVVSVLVNAYLLYMLYQRRRTVVAAPLPPVAPPVPIASPVSTNDEGEQEVARKVLSALAEAIDRFEYDWQHGLDEAGAEARKASLNAKVLVQELRSPTVRGMVEIFNDDLLRTPRGWGREHGASQQQMDALRRSHNDAVQAVGSVLRSGEY